MLNPHDLAVHAEYSLNESIPTLIGVAIAVIGFFLKSLITSFWGERDATRKEIRDIMISLGVVTEKINDLKKDVDALGAKMRSKG